MSQVRLTAGRAPSAVLFDLDGTLVDSAPDLAGAANEMRLARGLPELPYVDLRAMVGSGARGMVGLAFGIGPQDEQFNELRDEFLQRYESRITQFTQVFPGIATVLARLREQNIPWGIVTNKVARFSEPLVRALELYTQAATLISGDSTPHSKPHPQPLLEAARRMGVDPATCWYVGDDLRDMQAGLAAGMTTIAVAWGYLGIDDPIDTWGAHYVIQSPDELLILLGMA